MNNTNKTTSKVPMICHLTYIYFKSSKTIQKTCIAFVFREPPRRFEVQGRTGQRVETPCR